MFLGEVFEIPVAHARAWLGLVIVVVFGFAVYVCLPG